MSVNSGNMPAYNLPQTVFMLSQGSNYLFDQKAPVSELQAAISWFLNTPGEGFFGRLNTPSSSYPCLASLEGASPDWATVWGPVVYQAPLNAGATNAMYVARSAQLNTYVIAIAGTNPTGWSALVIDDLNVGPANMVSWPPTLNTLTTPSSLSWANNPNDPNACSIDAGTSAGIDALYAMQDTSRTGNPTLAQFLIALQASGGQAGQTLVFTGHSLGGALSPTLAMLFYPDAVASAASGNDTMPNLASGWENIYILPTAGPTPGTPAFAAQFYSPVVQTTPPASVLPVPVTSPPTPPVVTSGAYPPTPTNAPASTAGAQFAYWNMNYANVYDVVPRAWTGLDMLVEEQTIDSYPSFFANGSILGGVPGVGAGALLFGLVNDAMTRSGYDGQTTPYYAPCLPHYPLNGATTGAWGQWVPTAVQYPATAYPSTWTTFPANPPNPPAGALQQPPIAPYTKEIATDVSPYILNAHLDQYTFALLGYAAPNYVDTPPPG